MITITIITVCYNSATTIRDALASVAAQSYKRVEHVIVDGGSKDATVELIRRWQKHTVRLITEPDLGIYDAMNKGISMATGDVIGILNADDIYADDTVFSQLAEVFSEPTIDACYSDLVYVDKCNLKKVIRYWRSRPFESGLFEKGWVPAHPTFFVRKKIYEQYGAFDLDYKLAADYDLMARFLAKYKIRTIYVPRVLVKMRVGGATNMNIKNIIKQNIEIFTSCKKNNVKISVLSFLANKITNRVHQFYLGRVL